MGERPHQAEGSAAGDLTFLIADMRGYTRFTRERGDTAAAVLAKRFADHARDAVEARNGVVLELRGDEVLAVFTSPPLAVRAAVEFQLICAEETEADPDFPLLVGIGIDTGPAVPVEDGYRGVAINLAARLCSAALAGEVLLRRDATPRMADLDDQVVFAPRGPAMFKGFDEPVEVIGATPMATAAALTTTLSSSSIPTELDVETPLIGRDHEMRWLRGIWRQARRGQGRVVVVSGQSGIGKTRLAAQFAEHIDSQSGQVRYVGAGGTSTARALRELQAAMSATNPTLVVLDDADLAGASVTVGLEGLRAGMARRPVMVILLISDAAARSDLAALTERIDQDHDGHRRLAPLAADDIRRIVELYAGESIVDAPVESIVRASAGVCGLVHELASGWARSEATRRLEAAAEFMANRRPSDLQFANNVISLKLGRLYRPTEGGGVPEPEGAESSCPYRGLAAFDSTDARWFFGREWLVGELAARLVGRGVLAVVGASGSGKSSVVAAGLLPSLGLGLLPGSEAWTQLSMRPGRHPVDALRAVLSVRDDEALDHAVIAAARGSRLVLVIDQFEEIFTLCEQEDERAVFLSTLVDAATRHADQLVVVVTLRSDFYGYLASYPNAAALLGDNHVLVGPLTRLELQRVVELPARRSGVRIEAALVDMLVEEASGEPGALPLLSTTLVELWGRRDSGWIRLADYEGAGGMQGAVARLAESSFERLSEVERAAARRVLLRLAVGGRGETLTRRRVRLDEFDVASDPAAAAVIAQLTHDRLLVISKETVEVAHEALLREWPRLQQWLTDDEHGRQLHQHLIVAARTWDDGDREPSELYRGARLSATLDWSADHESDLNELERAFLGASGQLAERSAESARQTNRRLRSLLIGAASLLALALVAGGVAVSQRSTARHAATSAVADSTGAQAVSESRLDLAMLEAREAVALAPSPRTRSDLLTTLLRAPTAIRTYQSDSSALEGIAVNQSGTLVALLDSHHTVDVEDTSTGQNVRHFTTASSMAFGPDGSLLVPAVGAALDGDGNPTQGRRLVGLQVLDPTTGARRGVLQIPPRFVHRIWTADTSAFPQTLVFPPISFNRNGTRIAVGFASRHASRPGYVLQLHYPGGGLAGPPLRIGSRHTPPIPDYSPDGRGLVVTTGTQTTEYDASTGRRTGFQNSGSGVSALSPDGQTLAFAHGGILDFLDLRTGHVTPGVGASDLAINAVDFTPDGRMVVSSGQAGNIVVWNAANHRAEASLDAQRNESDTISAQAISSDGSTLYTANADGTATAWDLTHDRGFIPTFEAATTNAALQSFSLAVSPDNHTVAVGSTSGIVHIWDASTQRQLEVFQAAPEAISALSYSPDGHSLLVAAQQLQVGRSQASYLRLWHLGQVPALTRTISTHFAQINWAVMSPDGTHIAACGALHSQLADGGDVGAVVEWRTGQQQPIAGPTIIGKGQPYYVTFAPSGDNVAAGGNHGTFELVDPTTRSVTRQTILPTRYVFAIAYSPDGNSVLVGDLEGSADLIDARSGRVERTIPISPTGILALAWSPDAATIAVADETDTVRLIDPTNFNEIGPGYDLSPDELAQTTRTGIAHFPYLEFSPDGTTLYATDETGRVWVLPITVPEWEADACRVANRAFTTAEWEQVAPGRPYQPGCTTGARLP